ncbi:Cell wall beta-glucan synthesis [Penicillium roqueforti FM164]|uniref:Cell wall beta-glucan synthesis n=1 Tax=Penicillium roqueforti (strain FM164) TaxID=1365484 RepID=W6Q7M6_PENRF|nr:Cell wall beta-glucan synthesis [Penicillium roqueforti FM164]
MRFSTILSLLPLALSVGAIQVTEPSKGDDLDLSKSFTVKWTSVNTDASTVDIVLVNNAVYPPVDEKIASGIDTSKGSYTASGLKDVSNGSGFQINLLSTEAKNTGILAQSEQFNVTAESSSSSTTTATGTSTGISTGTTTGTTTGTSTGSSTTETTTGTTTGLTTSTSTTTGTSTSSASPSASSGAAMGLVAPATAAGLLAGVLALL